jgi:hypothetical protein
MFQSNLTLLAGNDVFRRHVSRALLHGALRSYFWREEYYSIYTLADLAACPTRTRPLQQQGFAGHHHPRSAETGYRLPELTT